MCKNKTQGHILKSVKNRIGEKWCGIALEEGYIDLSTMHTQV
jgi:hypothetical protein